MRRRRAPRNERQARSQSAGLDDGARDARGAGRVDQDGGAARFVGGCVRNALLGRDVDDIDIATPLTPDAVTRRLQAAGLGAVPTGIEHGTVTAIANGKPFEITTLRRDVSTDGRRAVVAFTDGLGPGRRAARLHHECALCRCLWRDHRHGRRALPISRPGASASSAMPPRASARIICASCACSAFMPGTARANSIQPALHAAGAEREGLQKLSGERIAKEMLKLSQRRKSACPACASWRPPPSCRKSCPARSPWRGSNGW